MRIKALREAAGLTKTELARAMEVDLAAVHRWETGTAMPQASKLPKLAAVLGVTVNDLYDPSVYNTSLTGKEA